METQIRKLVGTVTIFGGLRTYDYDSVLGLKIDLKDEQLTIHGLTDTEAFRLLRQIDGIKEVKPKAATPAAPVSADETPGTTPVELYADGDKVGAAEAERESVRPPTPKNNGAKPKLTKKLFAAHVSEAKSVRETVVFLLGYDCDEAMIVKLCEQFKDEHCKLKPVKDVAPRVRSVLKKLDKEVRA